MNHLSREGAEKLPDFTTQSHPIQDGRYVVKHATEEFAEAKDDQIQSTVWFRTPPLIGDTVRRISALKLFAESRDQGEVDDRSQGNWTWFELAIFQDQETNSPRDVNGVQLVEYYACDQEFGTGMYEWLNGGAVQRHRGGLLNLLEEGNTIGVRICARFPGWYLSARKGYLVVEIGPEDGIQKPPIKQMGQVAQGIKAFNETINEINIRNDAAFKPSIPEAVLNLDEINKGLNETPLRVLCLDGGGVRGLASLKLLQALMAEIDPANPDQQPYKVFDMIGGTSTGGLIAIMLGCLKMTVQECIDQYQQTMTKVFEHNVSNAGRFATQGHWYRAENLEQETKALVKARLGNEDALLYDPNNQDPACKVFVMSVDSDKGNNSGPVFLRSYNNTHALSEFPRIKIWEAARATSAAPSYFEPLQIGDRKLVDGGLAANNPLGWLWTEIVGVFGPARRTRGFVSIGTGIPGRVPLPDNLAWHPIDGISALAGIATNTEMAHILFRTLLDAYAPVAQDKKYYRLNISKEIMKRIQKVWLLNKDVTVEVKMDDVDKAARKALLDAAEEYIKANGQQLQDCANLLRR